jgi:muramoyltetrapeptide carboxypeptidase
MAAAFQPERSVPDHLNSLRHALEGGKNSYQCAGHPLNRKGTAVGELVGGNLALLAHLCGTPSELKTKGRILFIEDVGEFLYNIDRMLLQLKRCGKLDKLAGLVVGGFTENKDTDRPFGRSAEEIIRDAVEEYDYPVCFGFPVSHGKENVALKVGVGYKLRVSKTKAELGE